MANQNVCVLIEPIDKQLEQKIIKSVLAVAQGLYLRVGVVADETVEEGDCRSLLFKL